MNFVVFANGSIIANTLKTGNKYLSWTLVGSMKKPNKRTKAVESTATSKFVLEITLEYHPINFELYAWPDILYILYIEKATNVPNNIHPISKKFKDKNLWASDLKKPVNAQMLKAFSEVNLYSP